MEDIDPWTRLSRRRLLERAMLAAAAAAVPGRAFADGGRRAGSDETLRVAVVGVKGRGANHLAEFLKMKDVEVVAVVDVDPRVAEGPIRSVEKKVGKPPAFYKDARKMLEDKSIDAVSIATTDHTHALLSIWAMQAGKHVYVEKPVSHNIFEGRKTVEAARKYKRVCQSGHQYRSMEGNQTAMAFLRAGNLGKIRLARGIHYGRRGSIGKKLDGTPPEGVDYDLWLGPAPVRPFNPNRFHYNWHWFWDYGASDLTANGVHHIDLLRWGLGKKGLARRVVSAGGRYGYEDDAETPNTQIAWYDYGDGEIVLEVRGLDTPPYRNVRTGLFFEGEGGVMVKPTLVSATVFDRDGKEVRTFAGGGGDHFRNFVDAIRSGKPSDLAADIEEGHVSAALCHMAQASYRLGTSRPMTAEPTFRGIEAAGETFERMRKHLEDEGIKADSATVQMGPILEFDPASERFTGNDAANRDLLTRREYRKPFVVPDEV
jgi:predicted dehydrogenase